MHLQECVKRIERVDLKAILTPTNCRWNLAFFQKIQEEHRTMTM
ncbi:DUF3783 domain-containing protein [Frisingicoccus sp.]